MYVVSPARTHSDGEDWWCSSADWGERLISRRDAHLLMSHVVYLLMSLLPCLTMTLLQLSVTPPISAHMYMCMYLYVYLCTRVSTRFLQRKKTLANKKLGPCFSTAYFQQESNTRPWQTNRGPLICGTLPKLFPPRKNRGPLHFP